MLWRSLDFLIHLALFGVGGICWVLSCPVSNWKLNSHLMWLVWLECVGDGDVWRSETCTDWFGGRAIVGVGHQQMQHPRPSCGLSGLRYVPQARVSPFRPTNQPHFFISLQQTAYIMESHMEEFLWVCPGDSVSLTSFAGYRTLGDLKSNILGTLCTDSLTTRGRRRRRRRRDSTN